MLSQYYLWSGLGAIEDLDCHSDNDARAFLEEKVSSDWTLWKREGFSAKLLGVKSCASGETINFYQYQ